MSDYQAVDAAGHPLTDPSENVRALNEAGLKRQDDLREAEARHVREVLELRTRMVELRAWYDNKLRIAEAARIDANRAGDLINVQSAAQAVTAAAEALRLQVEATAKAAENRLVSELAPLRTDIADLRRTQYQGQGEKSQIVEHRQASSATIALIGLGITLLLAVFILAGYLIAAK